MTTENLACPFCGASEDTDDDSGPRVEPLTRRREYVAFYLCGSCGARTRGLFESTPEEAVALAVKAWNTRKPPAASETVEDLRAACDAVMRDRRMIIDERDRTFALMFARAEKAEKTVEKLVKMFTPRLLRYAPKDRVIIGVDRPPYEETTFFYDVMWSEDHQWFVTPYINAINGATHFLDPENLIGLPPQERLSKADRRKANQAVRDAITDTPRRSDQSAPAP